MKSKIEAVINLLVEKKYDEAKEILEEIASSDPENPEVLYNLGMCYSELGKLRASIETLKKSLEYKPNNPNALTALGFSYTKFGHYDEAEKVLLKALELEPNNLYAIFNLGGLYGKMGRYDLALKILEQGERSFPDDSRIIYGLGLSNQKLNNFVKASGYFKKLIRMEKTGQFTELAKTGLREIAEEEFKKAGLRPDAVMYCLSALELFSKMSKPEIKKIAFEIALKGRTGFDTSHPNQKYQLISLPGNFSGLHLVCYMYVGFKMIAPEQDIGFDLSKEYEAAKKVFDYPTEERWN